MPKPETKIGKFKFFSGLCGEVVGLGMFYGVVVMGIFILFGVEDKSISSIVYFISAVLIGGAWLIFRIKRMKQGKYYINEL
jgi:hypothetical protein